MPATLSRAVAAEATGAVLLSEVIADLSFALDLTEGQPEGHAVRSCLIGMRLADEIGLASQQRSALSYALLLKDLGGSSTAARIATLFGADDRAVKRRLRNAAWPALPASFPHLTRSVMPHGRLLDRALGVLGMGLQGPAGVQQLVAAHCERGAGVARMLALPEETAQAIQALQERWDGRGQPRSLRGEEIPLLARICGLAQTVEVVFAASGRDAACDVAWERRGNWFFSHAR